MSLGEDTPDRGSRILNADLGTNAGNLDPICVHSNASVVFAYPKELQQLPT